MANKVDFHLAVNPEDTINLTAMEHQTKAKTTTVAVGVLDFSALTTVKVEVQVLLDFTAEIKDMAVVSMDLADPILVVIKD